jgi:fibronectin-binding autotransporter adhesin
MNAQSRNSRRFHPLRTHQLIRRNKSRVIVAAAVGALGLQLLPFLDLSPHVALGATLTWDPNSAFGGNGTWQLNGGAALADWYNGTTTVKWTDSSASGTDTAIFGGGSGTVTLKSNVSAAGIVFNTDGYQLNGATDTITLGSGGLTTSSASVSIASAISLATTQNWLVNDGTVNYTIAVTGSISGAGGITLNGTGVVKLTATESYTGNTTVNNGTLLLNFGTASGANSNILNPSSTLTLGSGELLVNSVAAATSASSQTVAVTSLTPGESDIALTTASGFNPTLNLSQLNTSGGAGQALDISSGLAMLNGSTSVAATATLTIGTVNGATPSAQSILNFNTTANNNSGVGGGDFATAGLYDWAAIDPTGTFVEGGSQDNTVTGTVTLNFYKPYASSGSVTLASGSNADISASFTTKSTAETPASIRYNSATAVTTTLGGPVQTGGILVTPNVANNNVNISGIADSLTPSQSTAIATELVVFQNNTLGFLNINTGIGAVTNGNDTYTQAGAGTVELGTATNLSTYKGSSYLDDGTTVIAADGDLGQDSPATSTLFLQGGMLVASGNFALDAGGGTNPRPINVMNQTGGVMNQTGGLAAETGDTLTVDGAITGTGTLFIGTSTIVGTGSGTANTTVIGGRGTVILSGGSSNTYSGGTAIRAATLRVDGATSNTGSGAVMLNVANSYLIGNGVVGSNVLVKSTGHIAPGDSGIGTLTMSSLTLNTGSNLDFEFATSPSPSNDQINIGTANGLSFATGPADINLFQVGTTTSFDAAGTYNLIQFNNGTSLTQAAIQSDFTIGNPLPSNVATYTLGLSGNDVTLTINSVSINATWNNTGGSTWANAALDQTGSDTNWTGGVAPFQAGDIANFLTTPGITSASTIDLNISETVGTINFKNTASYTIATNERSTLTLDSGSSSAAAVIDSGGTHTLAVPIALNKAANLTVVNSTDSLVISGAISGSTAITINPSPTNGQGTVILTDPNGNAGYSGQTTINAGTLQVGAGGAMSGSTNGLGTFTGTLTNNGTLSYDLSTSVTVTNKIAGTGTLQQIGTGVLDVDHNDTMSLTNVLNGTLQLGTAGALGNSTVDVSSPGILDVNGKSPTISVLVGSGTIDDVSAGGTSIVTIGNAGITTANDTFSGSIQDTTGVVSLVQAGSGTVFLSGASSYTGGTTINAGAIKISSNSALGTGTVTIAANVSTALQLANGVNLSNSIAAKTGNVVSPFEDVPDPGASATLSGSIISISDVHIGTSQPTSTLILTGSSSVGAATTNTALARGNVVFAGNADFVSIAGGTPMVFGRYSSTSTLGVIIQDNAVVQSNAGVELGGSNGANDDLSSTITLTGSGTLNTGPGYTNLNDNSQSVGTVTLNLAGTSTLATSGFIFTSTSGASTTVNLTGGTILANGNDPAGSEFFPNISSTLSFATLNVNVGHGGGTINNNGNGITIGQALIDGGGSSSADTMTFMGTGTTTLTSNSSTYAGNTTIGDGVHATTLVVSNSSGSATGTGNVVLNSGVLASGVQGIISGSVLAGSGSATIAPGGVGSVGTLSVGGLTTSSSTTLAFDLGSGAGPEISNGDLLILNAATVTIGTNTPLAFTGTPVAGDDYRLIGDNTSGATVDAIPLSNFALPSAPAGLTYTLSPGVDSGYIDLVVGTAMTGPQSLTWNNTGGAAPNDGQTWDINNNHNWNNGTATTVYTDGSIVTFNDNNGGPNSYNVTLNTTVKPASVTVTSSLTYSIGGTGTIGGTGSLTQSGSGVLILSTPNTYSGGTSVTAGTLIIERTSATTSALPTGAVAISGNGTLQLAQNVTAGSANASPPPATSNVNITSLAITGNGVMDITNNHIIIDYTPGNDPISSIVAMITAGYDGGTWGGDGIISSLAHANPGYAVGYADSADPGNPAGLASDQIEIAYTLLGDANLDGKVNGSDFTLLASNFNDSVSNGWDEGDFNYSNTVNGDDFVLLAENFNQFASQSALAAADLQALDSFAAANGISLTSVPEPASAMVITLGAVGMLARRRRKQ